MNTLYGQNTVVTSRKSSAIIAKRLFDLGFGIILSILALPLILVIALVLFLVYKKSPFYTQVRGVSLESSLFTIIKFRTMFSEAQVDENPREFLLKKSNMSISPFCAWLRKTGLDELPQLFNVLKGDMSFIGPRPLSFTDLNSLKEFFPSEYAVRAGLSLKPGVSGYWQIFGKRSLGVKNLVEMDAEYANKMSFAFDCYLIWKTIPVMIMAEHSDALLGGREEKVSNVKEKNSPPVVTDMCTVKLNTWE